MAKRRFQQSTQHPVRSRKGFSLIELVGVIAVIAILAAIIAPRVVETIEQARIAQTVASIQAMRTSATKAAVSLNPVPLTDNQSRFDDLLIAMGLLDGRFRSAIGVQDNANAADVWSFNASTGQWEKDTSGSNQNTYSRVVCKAKNSSNPANAGGCNFRLDGSTDLPAGARIVSVAVENVTPSQALALSREIDGPQRSESDATSDDHRGRVVYEENGNATDVFVYLLHQ